MDKLVPHLQDYGIVATERRRFLTEVEEGKRRDNESSHVSKTKTKAGKKKEIKGEG